MYKYFYIATNDIVIWLVNSLSLFSLIVQVIDLGTQLYSFKNVVRSLKSALGDAEAKTIFSRAVYLFYIGGNDLVYPLVANSSLFQSNTKEKFVDFVIGNTKSVVEVKVKPKTDLKFIEERMYMFCFSGSV